MQPRADEHIGGARVPFCTPAQSPLTPRSPGMRAIRNSLGQIARSDAPVVLRGESGVGKEVLAREIHALSPRSDRPFVKINCAALPLELLESELFGYERGAFTGAVKTTPGKIEAAEGGTILLDEIGDMDVRLQAKLLHVLQDHEFQRLGGHKTVRVNVRVLAATHCDLERLISEGRFREDLYYRLNVITVRVPPLRERTDEVIPLAEHFLQKYATADTHSPALTQELITLLLRYHWPGNVRELENVIRRLLVFGDPALIAGELAASMPAEAPRILVSAVCDPGRELLSSPQTRRERDEAAVILQALNATCWNRRKAAALLQTDYHRFLYRMRKFGLVSREPGTPVLPLDASGAADGIAVDHGVPEQADLAPGGGDDRSWSPLDSVRAAHDREEADAIIDALDRSGGNRRRAAVLLGMDYRALLYRIGKLGIGHSDGTVSRARLGGPGACRPKVGRNSSCVRTGR